MRLSNLVLRCGTMSLLLVSTAAWAQQQKVDVTSRNVALLEDEAATRVNQYTMTNTQGMTVSVINHGATITQVLVPDRTGTVANVTLHFDDPKQYLAGHPLFGSIVGRYANRIADAQFTIDGTAYSLEANSGQNHIHGGKQGFQRLIWNASPVVQANCAGVCFTHTSPDGHAGYPGKLEVKLTYLLTTDNQLVLEYWATTDKPTHVNLTNHAYWNLKGVQHGNVLDHIMMLNATQYLEASPKRFPSGKFLSVTGTPMDFRKPQTIGSRIKQLESENYDDCYVINKKAAGDLVLAARVEEPKSGRVMEVLTTTPGVQFYTAKSLNGRLGAKGASYGPYHGFCLETQHYPDSPNQPNFPSTLLRPGETYHQKTIYRFSVKEK